MNEGKPDSDPNILAFGAGGLTMTQVDFFKKERVSAGLLKPNFSLIRSGFQFNKASDPSYANRDALTISGFGQDLYLRQTGVTQIDDSKLDYNLQAGTSAFYVRNYDMKTQVAEVVGCTDYSYAGDYNTAGMMTTNDCR